MNTPLGRGGVTEKLTTVILLQSVSIYRSNLAFYMGIFRLIHF